MVEMHRIELFINNEEVKSERYREIRDPGRLSDVVGHIAEGNAEHVEQAVEAAHCAFQSWKHTTLDERSSLLLKAADLLQQETETLAPEMTRESGMLVSNHLSEIPAAAQIIRNTVEAAQSFFKEEVYEDENNWISVEKRPLGVIAALTPWNVPLTITMNKVAPILITGNTVVIKPSPTGAIGVSIALQKMAKLFPPGVINVVHGDVEVGKALITHPMVRKVTLTGGGKTAISIMHAVADSLKRVHFELGGNDPAIILDDAPLDAVIPQIVESAFVRSGQVCVATKRVYIPEKLFDDFCHRFIQEVDRFKIGHGLDERATFGPVNNKNQYDFVNQLIENAKKTKAAVLSLGEKLEPDQWDNGYYIHPTVVVAPNHDDEIVQKEQFGPVIPLIPYRAEEEVIRWANETEYGLGSSVWSNDFERALRVARQIEAGMTGINGRQHSRLGAKVRPFGGVKQSGIGWETGEAGLREYVNYHSITYHKNSFSLQ